MIDKDLVILHLYDSLVELADSIDTAEKNFGALSETNPQAYMRWYNARRAMQDANGIVNETLKGLEEYHKYMRLPWWKRIFRSKP